MDYGHYTTQTVTETVTLSNALANSDTIPDDGELRRMLSRFEITSDPLDTEGLIHLARRIREVFLAEEMAERVRILNGLLELYRPEPTIVSHNDEGYHLHYTPKGSSVLRGIGSSMVMALTVLLCDYGPDRLGVCPACEDLFVDTTRNGRQRFCSRSCANRVHVAEHRARQAQ